MKKIELLSPAGSMEALKAAIHNGADAVYLSGTNYGARKYAPNFTKEELKEAIKYAHLYDVKVYVTVNTLIYETEIKEVMDYLNYLYTINVDAVLMQDIGLMALTKKLIPALELHASTQCNTCNDEALKLLKKMGITRAVLARELSLKEINDLKTDIEKEIFVYGALCICYSGCCLMSFYNGGRSGNRGMCAGPCRLPYTLIMDDQEIIKNKYLLSTKELNTLEKLPLILNSNVQSLKIEGRMKSAEYTGYVTKIFRSLIDNKNIKNYETNLKKLFNRGFTFGHLFQDTIINDIAPNHQGIKIGHIQRVNKYIQVKLTSDLKQNDGIRFLPSNKGMIASKIYDKNFKLINKANKGDIIYLDNKFNLKSEKTLLKTYDDELNKDIKNYPLKKLIVTYQVTAKKDKPLIIKINHHNYTHTYQGNIVTEAKTSPITKEDIFKHLNKLGNTPFLAKQININMDPNVFIPLKELNNARRYLIENIIKQKYQSNNPVKIEIKKKEVLHNNKINISAYVSNEKQLKYLLDKVDRIYTSNYNLYKKYKSHKIFLRLNKTDYHLKDYNNENLLITELGSLNKYQNNNLIADYTLNITNSFSASVLKNNKVNIINVSPECSNNDLKEISKYANNLETIVYGRIELMIMNYCLIKNNIGCQYCQHKFALKDKNNQYYPVINNRGKNIILSPKPINKLQEIAEYQSYGLNNFRLNFYEESIAEIKDILNKIKAKTNL